MNGMLDGDDGAPLVWTVDPPYIHLTAEGYAKFPDALKEALGASSEMSLSHESDGSVRISGPWLIVGEEWREEEGKTVQTITITLPDGIITQNAE